MKCLSLYNPWAVLMVTGHKRVETRSWPTRHRGPLLIHAARKRSAEFEDLCLEEPFRSALAAAGYLEDLDAGADVSGQRAGHVVGHTRLVLPLGVIVGRVNVTDCHPTDRLRLHEEPYPSWEWDKGERYLCIHPRERAFGDYAPGRFAWVCTCPEVFTEPVPYRGRQQLFDVPDTLLPTSRR